MGRGIRGRRVSGVRRLFVTFAIAVGALGVTSTPASAALLSFNTCTYYYNDLSWCAYASYNTPAWVWTLI